MFSVYLLYFTAFYLVSVVVICDLYMFHITRWQYHYEWNIWEIRNDHGRLKAFKPGEWRPPLIPSIIVADIRSGGLTDRNKVWGPGTYLTEAGHSGQKQSLPRTGLTARQSWPVLTQWPSNLAYRLQNEQRFPVWVSARIPVILTGFVL